MERFIAVMDALTLVASILIRVHSVQILLVRRYALIHASMDVLRTAQEDVLIMLLKTHPILVG